MVDSNALDAAQAATSEIIDSRARSATARPWVRVWDKEGDFLDELNGEIELSVDDLHNETGDCIITLPGEHHLAKWSLEQPIEAMWSVTVEDPEHPEPWTTRWSGTVAKVNRDVDDTGAATVIWTMQHDMRMLQALTCWASPLAPPGAQFPKEMLLAGPAETVIKAFLVSNLIRQYAATWSPPADIWNPEAWQDAFADIFDWPIFCAPPPDLLHDTTPWTVLHSRFATFTDLIADTLNDGQLQLKVWRWLPGDKQLYGRWAVFTRPTVVVDVVEQSGRVDYTGTIVDGALKYVSYLTDDLLETGWQSILDPSRPTTPGTLDGREAIPVWRESEHAGYDGIPGAGMEITKPTAWQITHGGKSPGWVNAGVKLGVNSALGIVGNFLGVPGLNGVLDDQIEDVLLAFATDVGHRRRRAMGRFGPPERFIASGNGFSISSLQVGRTGMHDTRGFVSYTAAVVNGDPYTAYWDFGLGDRVGIEQGGTVWVTRVTAIRRTWNRDTDLTTTITLGDPRHPELPEARLLKELAKVGGVLRALGVDA